MKNYWTKKECEEVIRIHKNNTCYYEENGGIGFHQMYNMLRYKMQFGESETMIIIASIIKSGGKIYED